MSITLCTRSRSSFFPRARALIAALVLSPALFVAVPVYADTYILGGGGGGGGGGSSQLSNGGGGGGGGAGGYVGNADSTSAHGGNGGNGGQGGGGSGGNGGSSSGSNGENYGAFNGDGGNGSNGVVNIVGPVTPAVGNGGRGGDHGSLGGIGDAGVSGGNVNVSGIANGGSGGAGGAPGTAIRGAGGGGGGGAAALDVGTTFTDGTIAVKGGNGGNPGSGTRGAGGGGGGSARLTATNLNVSTGLTVASGANGTGGSLGGAAYLTVNNTLTASGTISLTKNGGDLGVSINTLAVPTSATATLNRSDTGTSAPTNIVSISGLSFAGNSTLNVAGSGTMNFSGNLFVSGLNNLLNNHTTFNASSSATFALNSSMTDGNIMLTGPIELSTATTYAVTGSTPGLTAAGQYIVLINGFSGTTSTMPADTGITFPNGDKLVLDVQGSNQLIARRERTPATVIYDINNGTGTPPASYTGFVNDIIASLPDSTGFSRLNHEFAGWNTDSTGTGDSYQPGVSFTVLLPSQMLYAQWKAVYTVTYAEGTPSGAVSMPVTANVAEGNSYTVQGPPTLTNYTFMGWHSSNDNAIHTLPWVFTMPSNNVTLTAQWEINKHTVTYNHGGHSSASGIPSPVSDVEAGSTYTIDGSIPTLLNYTFDGWMSDDAVDPGPHNPSDNITMPDAPLSLTAQWKINKYTVTYNHGGHSSASGIPSPVSDVEAGSTYTIDGGIPTLPGYTFNGWTRSDNGGVVQPGGDITSMPNADLILTAQWTLIGGTAKNIPLTPAAGLLLMMLGITATAGVATRRRKAS